MPKKLKSQTKKTVTDNSTVMAASIIAAAFSVIGVVLFILTLITRRG